MKTNSCCDEDWRQGLWVQLELDEAEKVEPHFSISTLSF